MLTVLMATRNGARILASVLESFSQLDSPASGWKLIVADNGSTDQTRQIIESFRSRLPLLYCPEPRQGKNFALNTGLDLAEGDLIVFTDDDVFPRRDWLVRLREAADAQPAYAIFGGAVVPRWETAPPAWIRWVEAGPVYTLTDPALPEGPVVPDLIFGPNMAIRAAVFEKGVRFDTSIGPSGAQYAMGSETEFTLRLASMGYKSWHVRGAVVEHFIRASQLKRSWVLRRAIRYGRGQYRLHESKRNTRLLLGVPRYILHQIGTQGIELAKAYLRLNPEQIFRTWWKFNFTRGKLMEARFIRREMA